MRNKRSTHDATSRCGAALVELAIVLFLLIALVFGCVDFGRFATTFIAVTNAAREGANFGGEHPFTAGTEALWKQKIQLAIVDEMSGVPNFSTDELTVSDPVVLTVNDASRVRVQVTYPFKTVVPWLIIPPRIDITRTAEMPVVR